ncbi:DUF2299 domain-containing protein [Stygiolobus azoricus]|uniref:DUF2299 domain-containing protein n=1 Tax=Stygiolobus azoricus TaxID=41675 RepID=A0A650CP05_9CREN|nr:DUF2299 domain-containing protein [Stygiolobus azoricus]QGR19518.1 DUF2299 domain-containing protein [Stygiolobus azoricus]
MNDKELEALIKELGLSITIPPQAKEAYHIVTAPPQGFPSIDIIRPNDSSKFYLISMGILIHPNHKAAINEMKKEDKKKFFQELTEDLLKMGVDFAFLPPGTETPEVIQVLRLVFMDSLTPNEFLNVYYTVRNAGMLVIAKINYKFGNVQGESKGSLRYV